MNASWNTLSCVYPIDVYSLFCAGDETPEIYLERDIELASYHTQRGFLLVLL
jgi:hypothetical protein